MNTNEVLYRIITRGHDYGVTADGLIELLGDEQPLTDHLPMIVSMGNVERRAAAVMAQQATAREIAERIASIRMPVAA